MPPRKTTTTSRKNYYHGNTYRTVKRTMSHTATYLCNSPKFKGLRNECQWRMGSYQNVYSQFTGTGQKTNLSPTIANRWMKYVNNGVQVFKFTNKDFCTHFGNRWANTAPTAAYRFLKNRYGNTIKDVARGKGNCWLVATTRTPTARPFTNYNW
jgi:hypothetical protein